MTLLEQAELVRDSSYNMLTLSTDIRNKALNNMADALLSNQDYILQENKKDMDLARSADTNSPLLDRLLLTQARIGGMANGLRLVALVPDPLGNEDFVIKRPNGLSIGKRRVPLGVIGIIYESRPNVTSDAIGLCVKAGNAVLLRGGSEAIYSNSAISDVIAQAGYSSGLPQGCIQFVKDTSRETATEMMRLNGYIDVLIPRGGERLIKSVVKNATVPVIETGLGNCHTYVHKTADIGMATEIIFNAKVSRPAVCNAIETILVDRDCAQNSISQIVAPLIEKGVELCGCEETLTILPGIRPATQEDWEKEYDDLKLAIRVVSGVDEAIKHINRYGTRHSECIITSDYQTAERFLNEVDAAAVYVNASTRFTDGEEFGFGAEIGISTQKLHARGPLGLHELTSIKYIIRGNGQIR